MISKIWTNHTIRYHAIGVILFAILVYNFRAPIAEFLYPAAEPEKPQASGGQMGYWTRFKKWWHAPAFKKSAAGIDPAFSNGFLVGVGAVIVLVWWKWKAISGFLGGLERKIKA